jgi:ABC-type antimicrobial peptide transport system permease subunit
MGLTRLLLRNLGYHWRGNLAVLLGVAVGTAVLTGALLVGDSLRGSLRDLTLRRLGWVDEALVAPRFFRQELAVELGGGPVKRICPVILLQATAENVTHAENQTLAPRRVRRVTVIGVDERFWLPHPEPLFRDAGKESPGRQKGRILWINGALAQALGIEAAGERVSLRLQKPSAVPRETLLGRRGAEDVIEEWTLQVEKILKPDEPGDHFSLQPSLDAPLTAYLPLDLLQAKLGLQGKVNALLVADQKEQGLESDQLLASMHQRLPSALRLEDWGLVLFDPESRCRSLFAKLDRNRDDKLSPREWQGRLAESVVRAINPKPNPTLTRAEVEAYYRQHRNYVSLESTNLLLEPTVADAALAAARETGLRAAPTLVYLANTISDGKNEIPYSVVAALDPAMPPPLGPFLPPGMERLRDDQIVLAEWKDSPLQAKPGDEITLKYYPPEHQSEWKEKEARFRLAGFVPLEGVAADPDLTPEFPGITDKLGIREWDPPFPYDNRRVKERDDKFWKEYRTTPKAYVTLETGRKLWASRFGSLTSVRLAPRNGGDLTEAAGAFRHSLLQHLNPERGGFVFDPVKQNALQASTGGTDFAQLFLGFSFFLIVAALLLVGLLFRLNLDRRASEVGLLLAAGYRRGTVRWLLLGEGAVLAALGAAVGLGMALAYAAGLVRFLAVIWPGGTLRSFLRPYFDHPLSLAIGFGASLAVSVLTIAWAVRALGRVPPSALLAGQTTTERLAGDRPRPRWSKWIAVACLLGAIGLALGSRFVRDQEARAGTFFGSGLLLLVAFLATMTAWMRSSRQRTVEGNGPWSVARLGVRNAARHPVRSLLTAGLLASAAFLIVAVEAFRRAADVGDTSPASPSGGFALLAESDLPLFEDLNSDKGRREMETELERRYQAAGLDAAAAKQQTRSAMDLLRQTTIYAFRVRAGDDASCLNLYQPRRPRLLGVPQSLIERGGFVFARTAAANAAERENPWLILDRDERLVPVFGEQNTVVWMLKKGLGEDVEVPTDKTGPQTLRIDGLLQDSVFQSGLLLSEKQFLRLYPAQEGYQFFLIDAPAGREREVKELLETALADRGFEVTPTAQRLESFLAVENTYLSTFQALGGLGLILGSLGLAVVLLRGVWERRGELALLRALGYRRGTLGWLVLAENGFLLLLGLAAGTATALLAVAPHLESGQGSVPWTRLAALLSLALVVGLAAGAVAVASTLRAALVPALRRE